MKRLDATNAYMAEKAVLAGMAGGASKDCFVIAPIGDAGSEVRKRSDLVFKHIIHPAAKQAGFNAVRADQIAEPGIITTQVLQHIIDDPMVIADLTGRNPNVFYELAVRHALRRPYVHLIQRGERIPFDIAALRTIEVDHTDLDSVETAKMEIVKQMQACTTEGFEVESPISVAVDLETLKKSGNPEQRQLADVLAAITEVRGTLATVEKKVADSSNAVPVSAVREAVAQEIRPMIVEVLDMSRRRRPDADELMLYTRRLHQMLETARMGEGIPLSYAEEMRSLLHRIERIAVGAHVPIPKPTS